MDSLSSFYWMKLGVLEELLHLYLILKYLGIPNYYFKGKMH
jgi:hypothetical protein